MDYANALICYLVSIFGIGFSIYSMVRFSYDKKLTAFFFCAAIIFVLTTLLGGAMLNAIN